MIGCCYSRYSKVISTQIGFLRWTCWFAWQTISFHFFPPLFVSLCQSFDWVLPCDPIFAALVEVNAFFSWGGIRLEGWISQEFVPLVSKEDDKGRPESFLSASWDHKLKLWNLTKMKLAQNCMAIRARRTFPDCERLISGRNTVCANTHTHTHTHKNYTDTYTHVYNTYIYHYISIYTYYTYIYNYYIHTYIHIYYIIVYNLAHIYI